jgi:hypothetical protein
MAAKWGVHPQAALSSKLSEVSIVNQFGRWSTVEAMRSS